MKRDKREIMLVGATALLVGMVLGVAIGRSRTPFGFTSALSFEGAQPTLVRPGEGPSTISAAELAKLLETNVPVQIVDVREPDEYATLHIPGAKSVPLGALWSREQAFLPDRLIVVYCSSDLRGEIAARELYKLGLTNVRYLDGGFTAWQNAGLAVVR